MHDNPALREANELALREEMEKKYQPKVLVNTRFMEVLASGDEPHVINIHMIQSITPRSKGGTYIYFANEPDALLVKHSYTDMKNALKQYFK